jgi:glycosyltransferase involved in cell wall biosynthesis
LASASEAFRYINSDGGFDIIHNHAGWWGITLSQYTQIPVVTTMHNDYLPLDTPEFEFFKNSCYYVAISKNQQQLNIGLNFAGVVYNAIDTSHYPMVNEKKDYLLFLSNMSKEKGADTAVKVAKDLNENLILSSKIDKGPQQDFFEAEVKPYVDDKQIIFYPPVDQKTKQALFAQAKCFLFPIDWEEPFGLVMLEAMASGTPVVAYKRGSVPEVIQDGKTGFFVESYQELLAAVKKVGGISPDSCRAHVEKFFSVKTMTDNYLAVYEKIIGISKSPQF